MMAILYLAIIINLHLGCLKSSLLDPTSTIEVLCVLSYHGNSMVMVLAHIGGRRTAYTLHIVFIQFALQ